MLTEEDAQTGVDALTVSISFPPLKMQDLPGFGQFILKLLNETNECSFQDSLFDWILHDNIDYLLAEVQRYKLFSYYTLLITTWIICLLLSLLKIQSVYLVRVPVEILILNTTLIICLPILVIVNSLLSTIRFGIRVYFKRVKHGRFLLMKSADSIWAQEVYAQCCNFNCLYVLEGECDLPRIRQKFKELIENPKYDRMRRTVVRKYGFFCWKRVDKMDIQSHVKLLHGATMMNPLTEYQVFEKMSDFADQVFPNDKPPWEVLVVPRYQYSRKFPDMEVSDGKRYFALIFRVHHAIMDGISAGQIIRNEIADNQVQLSVDPCASPRIPRLMKLLLYGKFLVTSVRNTMKSMLLMESNCFHTGKRLTGPKTFRWSRKIDLNSLRDLRSRTGVTTTGILLTAFGLALKNFASSKKLTLPTEIHAGSTVAILPYPNTKPQNRFILAHLPISVGKTTGLDNLREVQRATRNLSSSSDLIMNELLLWLVGRWPTGVQDIFLQLVHGTVLVSNVPGFRHGCTLFGRKLVDAVGWTPIKGTTGIGMCLFSYAGKVRAAMIADKVSLPDPADVDELIAKFEQEIESLAREGGCRSGG